MEPALYARLLAGAGAQYDGIRTLTGTETGGLGLTGDFINLREAVGMASQLRRRDETAEIYAVAKEGGQVAVYEFDGQGFCLFEPEPFVPDTSPRTRPSALV